MSLTFGQKYAFLNPRLFSKLSKKIILKNYFKNPYGVSDSDVVIALRKW